MIGNHQNNRGALAALFSLVLFAGCGDPGNLPAEAPLADAGLIEVLDLSFRETSLIDFDPATESYVVDVNTLVDEVTVRAATHDAAAEVVLTRDGLVVPLEDEQARVRLGTGATTLELEATLAGRVESYIIDIQRGELPFAESYVKAPSAEAGAKFGSAVALSGDTLAVGAPASNNPAPAVVVYEHTPDGWSATATVRGANTEAGDSFGASVALNGDTLVVGAPGESGNGESSANNDLLGAGAVYIFVRSGARWEQQAYIKAVSPEVRASFGAAVDIDGNTVVVGAPGESGMQGAAYVFSRVDSNWLFQGRLEPKLPLGAGDAFGHDVAVLDDTIAVTAPGDDFADRDGTRYTNSGAGYLFTRLGQVWSPAEKLRGYYDGTFESSPREGGGFGSSVDLLDGAVVVGAAGEGRAYIITVGDGPIEGRTSSVSAPGAEDDESFGSSVSADGDFIAVGADRDDRRAEDLYGERGPASGGVYLFSRTLGDWALAGHFTPSNGDAGDSFGEIMLDGDNLAVGALGEDGDGTALDDNSAFDSGAVYLFR
jgi:hypothetical protein